MKRFEEGKRYTTHHLTDPNKTLTMTVFIRGQKSVLVGVPSWGNSQVLINYMASSDSESINAPEGYAPFEAANEYTDYCSDRKPKEA